MVSVMAFFEKYKHSLLGILIGGIVGFLYYRIVGCNSGSCAITSNPLYSTLYGMFMGYLLFSVIKKSPQSKSNE